MRLELIDGLRTVIIALLVYVPTVTISGWFTAWTAKRCGDDLPERFGFLTLDPFAHFSFFGFTFLLIGELFGNYLTFFRHIPGFGKYIILDPQPMQGKRKVILEFFARSLAHFAMLTIALIVLFSFFKQFLLLSLSGSNAQASSLSIVWKEILSYFFNQNRALCGVYFLFGLADTICFLAQIPRMFSLGYFVVLISTLLLLSAPVEFLLSVYVQVVASLFVALP